MSAVEKVLTAALLSVRVKVEGEALLYAADDGTMPLWDADDEDMHAVRAALAPVLADVWDEGHRFTGYDPTPGENPYRAGGAS